MKENSSKTNVSKSSALKDIGEFWDNHSLADYWDQTREAEFRVSASRRLLPVEHDRTYALHTPYETFGAGEILMKALKTSDTDK